MNRAEQQREKNNQVYLTINEEWCASCSWKRLHFPPEDTYRYGNCMDEHIECVRTGRGGQPGRRTRLSKIWLLLLANIWGDPGLRAAAG